MIAQSFEYHLPKTLSEAMRLAAQFGDDGKFLAGGHSLIPLMKLRLAAPKHLIDIGRISELGGIREEGERIRIGAAVTHFQLESSEMLKARCPLLPETAAQIGDVQVRNKGTIGGSIAHADPAADWPATLLALDAEIHTASAQGERSIPIGEFFLDLLTTALEPAEILTSISVPALPERGGDAYAKFPHPASGFAVIGVAARVVLDEKGGIAQVGVGITGIGPKAYRATGVESLLRGKTASSKRFQEASSHAADGIEATGDIYASAEYRAHLARVYTRRALEKGIERAAA